MSAISRRQLLVTSLSVTFAAQIPAPAYSAEGTRPTTQDSFKALSRAVTGRRDLADDLIDRFFPYFLEEPWGPKHIETAWLQVSAQASETNAAPDQVANLIQTGEIKDGEAWFIRHLATTYYTGTYYYEGQAPVDIAGRDALIWSVIEDLVTTPGDPDPTYGHWATPPSNQILLDHE